MATHPYTLLDVFTDTPLEGNPLAVVHDADELDDATMLRFARETRLSETTFVQSPTAHGADYRNRIWMMSGEIPFAGHPSLGTAVAVARRRGDREVTYVQQTGAGLQPVDVRLRDQRAEASMRQEPPLFGAELDPPAVLAAIGLAAADADPLLPPQVVSTGVPQVIAPVRREALERVRPDWTAIAELLSSHGAIVLYATWCDASAPQARARSFAGSAEIGEDPATGSAAGPLCAFLAERRGQDSVEVTQGVEMRRPSRLSARMEGDRPRVGGAVVQVIEGSLRL